MRAKGERTHVHLRCWIREVWRGEDVELTQSLLAIWFRIGLHHSTRTARARVRACGCVDVLHVLVRE